MRVLRPVAGGGIGGIPTYVIAQPAPGSGAAAQVEITVTGTPTANGTHFVAINGRTNVDGSTYSTTILSTDNADSIAARIADNVNNVLGAPCTATVASNVVTLTAKWEGVTSDQLTAEVFTDGKDLGMSYAVAKTVSGAGTNTVANDLLKIGSAWNTIIVNSYGESAFQELETWNGSPDANVPVGRWAAIEFKPAVALWGSNESDKDNITAITNDAARKDQVTNVLCPAPNSKGFDYEAAANGALITAPLFQNTPHLSVNGISYNDMPVPSDGNIGDFAEYNNRDFMVKKGCSTVDLVNSKYVFQDFVTTYAPDGDPNASWRYVRSLMQDWNIRYAYFLLEQINVVDHAITSSDQITSVINVIKPKQWKQIVGNMADNLAERVIIVDPEFLKQNLVVEVNQTNPDRLDTFFRYKRSGIARIASTTAEAGFAFGVQ